MTSPKSSLPEWIFNIQQEFSMSITDGMKVEKRDDYKMLQALTIAWEALEYYKSMDDVTDNAKDALNRIRDLGETK